MKKADIIKSKHVDHIENEKKILERIEHPFVVIDYLITSLCHRWITTASYRTTAIYSS